MMKVQRFPAQLFVEILLCVCGEPMGEGKLNPKNRWAYVCPKCKRKTTSAVQYPRSVTTVSTGDPVSTVEHKP